MKLSEIQNKLDNTMTTSQLREKELQDKLDALNDEIESEKATREDWIRKFEGE